MEFDIDGIDIFDKLPRFLTDLERKVVPKANRRALNRALKTLKKHANKRVRKVYNLKQGEINRDYFTEIKAKGNRVETQSAALKISGRPVSLIRFLPSAKRESTDQKGIAVKKRKKITVVVTPGNKRKDKFFIRRGRKGSAMHVFKRNADTDTIIKQSVPGIPKKLKETGADLIVTKKALVRYRKEFTLAFNFFMQNAMKKIK